MFKLFRAIKSEHRKLWCKRSPFLWVVAMAALAACIFGAADTHITGDGEEWFLTNRFTEILHEKEIEIPAEEPAAVPLPVPTAPVSGSDTVSAADIRPVIIPQEPAVQQAEQPTDWHDIEKIKADAAAEKILDAENALLSENADSAAIFRERAEARREAAISAYRLANDVEPEDGRAWILLQMAVWLSAPVAAAVAAAAASDMFAGEFSRGTIYMNLARPVTRIKQYTAKMFTAGMYSALLMTASFLGALVTCVVKEHPENGRYVGCINDKAYEVSWMQQSLLVLACCFGIVMMCVVLCAAIGTLTRSRTASAVGALTMTAAGTFFGGAIAPVLSFVSGLSVFACLDLTAPLLDSANFPRLTFADCLVSFCVHFVFIFFCGYGFMKKDITE